MYFKPIAVVVERCQLKNLKGGCVTRYFKMNGHRRCKAWRQGAITFGLRTISISTAKKLKDISKRNRD